MLQIFFKSCRPAKRVGALVKMAGTVAVAVSAMIFSAFPATAFPLSVYAEKSQLADGRWVKVSVSETGMHFISASTLRSWGFSDPMKVRVHGYGGNRQNDRLTEQNYIDDLPEVGALRTAQGVYFYGVGPVEWRKVSGRYEQTLNPYTLAGYYFVTQGDVTPLSPQTEGMHAETDNHVTDFTERVFIEEDKVSLGNSGTVFFGDDFRYTRSRSYTLKLPDAVEGNTANLRVTFGVRSSQESFLDITVGGAQQPISQRISPRGENYGSMMTLVKSFVPASDKVTLTLTFRSSGVVEAAHLDAITVNYCRRIRMRDSQLEFESSGTSVSLDNSTKQTRVWDVTMPGKPVEMLTENSGNVLRWTNPYTGSRRYVAWNEGAVLPSPRKVADVEPQNLHGLTDTPDMVIFTVKDWRGEAERVANLHRAAPDNYNVLVVEQDPVFNEFSSGARDPMAFRRMLKMLYDRGQQAGKPLRFALFFGRPTYDNRLVTSEMSNVKSPFMPTWQSAESLIEGMTYTSDDVLGILDDNTGSSFPSDRISIAVGRIPCSSLTQAKAYVDKLIAYNSDKNYGEWRNSVLIEADNGNKGVFLTGLESLYNSMMEDADASNVVVTKVYYDAFNIQGGVATGARERFYRSLDEGVMMWIFNGHGAIDNLGEEGLHSRADVEGMNNRYLPFLIASTCSFGQWDGVATCGMERLAFNTRGGIVAGVCPTRKAYVAANDYIMSRMGNYLLRRDADFRYMTAGEMLKDAKNAVRQGSSEAPSTRLKFVYIGDPALRLLMPSNRIVLETVNGEEVTADNQPTVMARQRVTLSGSITDGSGASLDDFNGMLSMTLYDAEYTTTSLGLDINNTGGKAVPFEEKGGKLYTGRTKVVNGRFEHTFTMPSEVADNFRPATFNMYAWTDAGVDATGVCRDLYVYGYDDMAEVDSVPPVIDYAYLNHSSFRDGQTVNEQPMFLASVTDDIGINISTAGIGHQMSLKLDDKRTYSDVSLYYTPSSDGTPSGTVAYPISELEAGNHQLTFKVWDTDGNSASKTLSFFVEPGAAPQLFDIFTDANPAVDHANFYMSHNRPDAEATVTLEIFSIAGRRVWTSTQTDRSDKFLSAPIRWNLCDMGGQRVVRGIYIYRATLKIGDHEMHSVAKRIAVTGN